MNPKPVVCPISKPGKESARNCAKGLLRKATHREVIKNDTMEPEFGYSVDEIEQVIYDYFPSRETYLAKIAKIALHLSLFTRTGRVSYTFQNAIFDRRSISYYRGFLPEEFDADEDDYLTWLVTRATSEEIFPELYRSMPDYISRLDQEQFEVIMTLEHDAIFAGLNYVVRQCCDSKVCSVGEIDTSYDSELFKSGTPFETAARSICIIRKIQFWIPPDSNIYIPDTSDYKERIIQPISKSFSNNPDTGTNAYMREVLLERKRTDYESAPTDSNINRNFDVSGQVTCLNVDNLIHNLAILTPGKLIELPFDGALMDSQSLLDLQQRFAIEIGMRKYYLDTLYKNK